MSAEEDTAIRTGDGSPGKARHLVLAGLGAASLGFLVFQLPVLLQFGALLPGDFWTFVRILLLVGGALLTGVAVALQPRSPGLLLSAGGVAWLIGFGMDPAWDTARLVCLLLATVAVTAALLLGLPFLVGRLFAGYLLLFPRPALTPADADERGRFAGGVLSRVIVSGLVLLHFAGVVSCVLSTPPPNREGSWLANWVWITCQPYMQFCYLNNAFRFYSPEPGPPSLLWFYVQYSDGSGRWLKVPDRAEDAKDPLAQEFTRRLTLGHTVSQTIPLPALPEKLRRDRIAAGLRLDIPTHPELSMEAQYQVPMAHCLRNLSEYVRFVAQHYPPEKGDATVTGIKAYRVIHLILEPKQMASGKLKPTDAWTYLPYYLGDYTPEGELKDPDDPLLFWLIPIYAWPRGEDRPDPFSQNMPLPLETYPELDIHDYLRPHAQARPAGGRGS